MAQADSANSAGTAQSDLFSGVPVEPQWQPDPDKIRRRLERILAEMRSASAMPWDFSRRSLYLKIFPDMAHYLKDDEAAQYCLAFDAELERLKAA